METTTHRNLKRLALAYLRGQGCLAVAEEVRCPINRYRVDAAGYRDQRSPGRPATIVIECKQSRSDFLSDRGSADRMLRERRELERIAEAMERKRIMVEEPHLRRGTTSLFPQMDEWDFSSSRLPGYRKVMSRLRRLSEDLYGDAKFCLVARYRLADELYVAAPRGMLRPGELPDGWGLLECSRKSLTPASTDDLLDEPPALSVAVGAPSLDCLDRHRTRLLRNIAVAACEQAYRRRVCSA